MIRNAILLLLLCSILSSCKTNELMWQVTTGGVPADSVTTDQAIDLISSNETFALYRTTQNVIEPSNVISYSLYHKVKTDVDDGSRSNGSKDKKVKSKKSKKERKKAKKEKRKNSKVKKNKDRVKSKRERKKKVKGVKTKPQYAYVDVSKSFSKVNALNIINDVIAIGLLVPSYGQTAYMIQPVRVRDYHLANWCNHNGQCIGPEHAIRKKILIETKILVKNSAVNGDVMVFENLPPEVKVMSYKIKEKGGRSRIESTKLEKLSKEGEDYYKLTITPKDGAFKKDAIVWVIMDVLVTPDRRNYAIPSVVANN